MLRLRSALILEATHRKPVSSVVGDHGGTGDAEAEEARIVTANRTAPIDASAKGGARADIVERTIASASAACHGQFQR